MIDAIISGSMRILELLHARTTIKSNELTALIEPLFSNLVVVHNDYIDTLTEATGRLHAPLGTPQQCARWQKSQERLARGYASDFSDGQIRYAKGQLKAQVKATRARLGEVISFLQKRRLEHETLRIHLISLSREGLDATASRERAFIESVCEYFDHSRALLTIVPSRSVTVDTDRISTLREADDFLRRWEAIYVSPSSTHSVFFSSRDLADFNLPEDLFWDIRARWTSLCETHAALKLHYHGVSTESTLDS